MLELKDFEAAADRLKNVIHNIPLSTSCTFSAMTGAEVYLKYENQQKTGDSAKAKQSLNQAFIVCAGIPEEAVKVQLQNMIREKLNDL